MLPPLPLLVYLIDIQRVIRGSIAKNATPMLPPCYPWNLSQSKHSTGYRY